LNGCEGTKAEAIMADSDQGAKGPRRTWLVWLLLVFLAWPAGSMITVATTVRAYSIPTGSMAPALQAGDRVGVDVNPRTRPGRGEVWVFRFPQWSGMAPNQGVKRVIGLPGETVEVKGGKVLIDGRPLDEPYISTPISYTAPPFQLGADQYYVLGDSRNASKDSHVWGPVPGSHFVGPVKMRYWPPQRVGKF
jgi:signal peptidase I